MEQSITTASSRLDGILAGLYLPSDVEQTARDIVAAVEYHQVSSGRDPSVVAASTVYLTSLVKCEKRTQEEVAEAAGCTAHAIYECYPHIAHAVDEQDVVETKLPVGHTDVDGDEDGSSGVTSRFRRKIQQSR